MSIESLVLDVIEERKKVPFLKGCFYILSLLFQAVTKVRHFFYDLGICKSYKSFSYVISVGNIVAGGTGKTPLVRKLINDVIKEAGSVAIISRGYRSKKRKGSLQISEGKGPTVSSLASGDEPYWLAKETVAAIFVGKDRVSSVKLAEKKNIHVCVLEDGFQHRALQKDKEIVLLDALDLFGKGYFLPRGYLRDSPKRLARADLVVVTHLSENFSKEELLKKIRSFTKAPVVGFRSVYTLDERVEGSLVGAFCGIAKPELFYDALRDKGCQIVNSRTLSDHIAPSLEELTHFALDCKQKGAAFLVCTEKDLVKLLQIQGFPLPIAVLKMDLECVWNENLWKEMCQSIKNRV